MVSQETLSSPRISFSSDLLDEKTFISVNPDPDEPEKVRARREEFEFLSTNNSLTEEMLSSADELFFEGKLLPFLEMKQCEKLNKVNIGDQEVRVDERTYKDESIGNGWFIDEDPSPRPPSCTVLWKELLKLKKHNASSSPSSSCSASSVANTEEGMSSLKRVYKKTTSIRLRPVVNVPICSHQGRSNALPPLFSFKKGKLES